MELITIFRVDFIQLCFHNDTLPQPSLVMNSGSPVQLPRGLEMRIFYWLGVFVLFDCIVKKAIWALMISYTDLQLIPLSAPLTLTIDS